MDEYKKFAEDFAARAGQIMLDNFKLGMAKQWKSDNSLVTETDLKINSLLISEVKEKFPGHRIKAEEESSMEGGGEYVWVCDPVDGTIPFSHGIPISTFSLALTKNGESILGVILDPFQKRLFSAVKGEGAHMNGDKIRVSQISELGKTTGEYEMFQTAHYDVNKLQERLVGTGMMLMKLCSVAYPAALVAAGELGFVIFPHTTAHDGAAAKVIVEEAGGKVTDLFGEEQRYDQDIRGFIASNGVLHEELVSLCKELVTKKPGHGLSE
jgi:fructose-1,6-bisphosphatase/inositol monophosphatase family enzyme